MIDALKAWGAGLSAAPFWTDVAWPVIWILLGIVAIVAPLMGAVAYLLCGNASCWVSCKSVWAPTAWVLRVCCSLWLTA
jgi:hypothetical protein